MKTVQISILARVYGNVNADEVIGNRITIKKMYDSEGNIYPFVSARAIKYAIRMKLKEKGLKIDPFYLEGEQWIDNAKPWEYVDNDLFGYMKPEGGERAGKRRTAPVAISYFKAIKNTTITTDFSMRSPRQEGNPNIFEVEVADIIGKLNVLIYDYIGKPSEYDNEKWDILLKVDERKRRLKALLDILLVERFVLPRRTNSLNIPEYYYALIVFSDTPLPIYQYLDYTTLEGDIPKLDIEKLRVLTGLISTKYNTQKDKHIKLYLIDYTNKLRDDLSKIGIKIYKSENISQIIDEVVEWLIHQD